MKRLRLIEVAAVVMSLAAAPVLASDAPASVGEKSERSGKRPGKHKALGLTIGAIAGSILGGWAAVETCDYECGVGETLTLWTAIAVGGAVAGYALGGGFSNDRIDVVLEQGRESVRAAQAELASRRSLSELRLAALPGLAEGELPSSPDTLLAALGSAP